MAAARVSTAATRKRRSAAPVRPATRRDGAPVAGVNGRSLCRLRRHEAVRTAVTRARSRAVGARRRRCAMTSGVDSGCKWCAVAAQCHTPDVVCSGARIQPSECGSRARAARTRRVVIAPPLDQPAAARHAAADQGLRSSTRALRGAPVTAARRQLSACVVHNTCASCVAETQGLWRCACAAALTLRACARAVVRFDARGGACALADESAAAARRRTASGARWCVAARGSARTCARTHARARARAGRAS